MKEYFFIEGYKAKTNYDYEDTLKLVDKKAYSSEEAATAKAREYLEKDKDLSLMIIYKALKIGPRAGIKYIHRDEGQHLEEIVSWW
jgi:hypothetical protein